MPPPGYHHEDLRSELLVATAAELRATSPTALSVRRVAARCGVTHPAVSHHFGDKAGLLTAFAAEGYRLQAAALAEAAEVGDLLALGVAYLRFATSHREHFEVMYRLDLLHPADPDLEAARALTRAQLQSAATEHAGPAAAPATALAGWFLVHGAATLWTAGSLPGLDDDELEATFREVAQLALGHLLDADHDS